MANRLATGDRSYGIIPLRFVPGTPPNAKPRTSNTQVLLIHQKTIIPKFPYFWCFPKGHAEYSDDSLQHTAIRELEEETGLEVAISDILDLKESNGETVVFKEVYTNPVRNVGKEVRYWVALVKDGEQKIKLQIREVNDARWCKWEEALDLITFDETRSMLKKAAELLGLGSTAKTHI